MKPGQRVRFKTDPSRIGVLTDRKSKLGSRLKRGVQFDQGGHEYILEGSLELVPDEENLDARIKSGKYAGWKVLRNSITYRRLSGRLANLIYSMEATDTEFHSYQFKPVLNMLDSPAKGLLLADEVGLGKTIEAGLIWTELRSRLDARNLMVICPRVLSEKWQQELQKRFGVPARLADARELLATLKQSINAEINEFALVCSKDALRPPRGFKENEDKIDSARGELAQFLSDHEADDPLFNFVIVDEAHHMRNPDSMTSKLGRLIRPVTDYMALLSATPIQLANENLFQILRILDDRTYAHQHSFEQILQANEPIHRLREAVQDGEVSKQELIDLFDKALEHPLLAKNRQLQHMKSTIPGSAELKDKKVRAHIAADLERINLFSKVVSRTRKREVTEWRVVRQPISEEIPMSDPEKEFYHQATRAIQEYCKDRDINKGFLLAVPQSQIISCMPAALRAWQHKDFDLEEPLEEIDKEAKVNLGPMVTHLAERTDQLGNYKQLKKHDSKYQRLEEVLRNFFRDHPDDKLIIFARFRKTIDYLQERLQEVGIRCVTLMGGMRESKDSVIKNFQDDPSTRVLISSEVASEGVDLQFCRVLINYDLPWNPMKVEQRIGRIDRIGQAAEKLIIWNLFYADTIDARIYKRLHERLNIFKYALGSLEAVLGHEMARLEEELLKGELSQEQQEERISQTAQALENRRRQDDELEQNASFLIAHNQYILKEIHAAKELQRHISSPDLADYFIDYFSAQYPGTRIRQLKRDHLKYAITLSAKANTDLSHFMRQAKIQRPAGLIKAPGRKPISFIFDNKLKKAEPYEEVIDQFHPAIRFINAALRKETETLIPVAIEVSKLEAGALRAGTYGFMVKCWQVTGVRDSERLAYAALHLATNEMLPEEEAERLINTAARTGKDWPAARNRIEVVVFGQACDRCEDDLKKAYDHYISGITRENEDRADVLEETARNHFQGQIEKIEQQIEDYRQQGKPRMIPANRGKIEKLKDRLEKRLQEIATGRDIRYFPSDAALGIIEIR